MYKSFLMRKYLIIAALPLLFMASCAGTAEEYVATADSTSFANDITDINSPSRKIAKHVDVRCRVKDILNTVSAIEQRARSLGGMVAVSELQNQSAGRELLHYKADSLKEVNIYNATAHLQLRVPACLLDTMLATLPTMVDFIEYRNIRQDDRTLAYLRNAMKNQLYTAKAPVTKQPGATTAGKAAVLKPDSVKAEQVVDRRIENLQLLDDVNYTTINMELSQKNQIYTSIIPDVSYAASEPFATQLSYGLNKGLDLLKGIVVVLVTIWPLLLIASVIWIMYINKQRKRTRPLQ
jgi:hypothetical protein